MYNPKRFGMYIPSVRDSALPDCISQYQNCGTAFPGTPAQDLVRRYRAGLPDEDLPRCDNSQPQPQLSATFPLDAPYDWEYEPLPLSRSNVNRFFSPSCEALFSSAHQDAIQVANQPGNVRITCGRPDCHDTLPGIKALTYHLHIHELHGRLRQANQRAIANKSTRNTRKIWRGFSGRGRVYPTWNDFGRFIRKIIPI